MLYCDTESYFIESYNVSSWYGKCIYTGKNINHVPGNDYIAFNEAVYKIRESTKLPTTDKHPSSIAAVI